MPSKKRTNKSNQRLIRKTTRKLSSKKQLSQPTRQVKSEDLDVNFTYVPNTDEKDEYLIGSWIITKINNDTGKFKGGAKVCSDDINGRPIETYNNIFDTLLTMRRNFEIYLNSNINNDIKLNGSLRENGNAALNLNSKVRHAFDYMTNNPMIIIDMIDNANPGSRIAHATIHRVGTTGVDMTRGDMENFQPLPPLKGRHAKVGATHIQQAICSNITFSTRWKMCAENNCVSDPTIDNSTFTLECENFHSRGRTKSVDRRHCLLRHLGLITNFMCDPNYFNININPMRNDMRLRNALVDELRNVCDRDRRRTMKHRKSSKK